MRGESKDTGPAMKRKKHKTPARKRRPASAEPEDRGYTLPPRWWQGRDVGQIVINATHWQRQWAD